MKVSLNEHVKQRIKIVINEELGIAEKVKMAVYDVIEQIKESLKNPITTKMLYNNVKLVNSKLKVDGFEKIVNVYVNYYNFYDKRAFYEHCNEYEIEGGRYIGKRMVEINCYGISGGIDEQKLFDSVYDTIGHEMEHQYQGFNGSYGLNNGVPLYDIVSYYIGYADGTIERIIADMLYGSFDFEQDAFVNGMYFYLKKIGDIIPEWSDVMDTDAYHRLCKMKIGYKKLQNNINNPEWIKICKKGFKKNPSDILHIVYGGIKRLESKIGKVFIKLRKDFIEESNDFPYHMLRNKYFLDTDIHLRKDDSDG